MSSLKCGQSRDMLYELLSRKRTEGKATVPAFVTGQGNELKARYLVRTFTKVRDQVGLPDFRFHDLRHTFASRLVQRGVDLYRVQLLLGHKTGTMTQRYAHHCPESLRDGVMVLEKSHAIDTNRHSTCLWWKDVLCNLLN